MLCLCYPSLPTGGDPLLVALGRVCYLLVNALVAPAGGEERLDRRSRLLPFPVGHAGDCRELAVVIRQPALGPVVHDQQQIGAVQGRPQMAGVLEIVTDVQGHPREIHEKGISRTIPTTL
jgi:hypothetical protein